MKAVFPISYGRACVSVKMAPLKCSPLTETSMSSLPKKPPRSIRWLNECAGSVPGKKTTNLSPTKQSLKFPSSLSQRERK